MLIRHTKLAITIIDLLLHNHTIVEIVNLVVQFNTIPKD